MDGIYTREQSINEFIDYSRNTEVLKTRYKFLEGLLSGPSIVSIVARPQWGKTLLKDQLAMDIYALNKRNSSNYTRINGWLDFQLEMPISEKIKRELRFRGIDITNVTELEGKIKALPKENWITITSVNGINNLESKAITCYEKYGCNLVTIDHALIVSSGGKYMQELFEALVNLKKNKIYVIVLSQMSRNITAEDRCRDGNNKNRVYENDIYASDMLMQYSDVVAYIDRPDLRNLLLYSSAKIPIEPNNAIVGLLKNRFGELKHYKYRVNERLLFEFEEEINFSKFKKANIENKDIDYTDSVPQNVRPNEEFYDDVSRGEIDEDW